MNIQIRPHNKEAMKLRRGGFTLIEVAIAVVLLALIIGGMLTCFVMGRISTFQSRYRLQAMSLVRAKAEQLLADEYDDVQSEGPIDLVLDPGQDGQWGTDDDMNGTMWVDVADLLDLDGDNDTAEPEIDVNGDGQNDQCKAVSIRMDWTCPIYGSAKAMSTSMNTLIAKR